MMSDYFQDIICYLMEEDTPNPHFLDYSDVDLQQYIAQPNDTGDFLLSVQAAKRELSRRQRVREAFLKK